MHNELSNITLEDFFSQGDIVIAAVSGGPDSMAMLHLLATSPLKLQIIAVYIDHGLRPDETKDEINLIRQFTHKFNISFHSEAVDVVSYKQNYKSSTEEAARILRYKILEKIRADHLAKFIAVAHTSDDQVEEVLIRLIRGSNRKSLSGMSAKRDRIIRPLLNVSKETLLSYIKLNDIGYCIDSSNNENIYLRNRVRLDLIPYLEVNFNKSIRQTILQISNILTTEEDLLRQQTELSFKKCVKEIPSKQINTDTPKYSLEIDIKEFSTQHLAIQRRIIEEICIKMQAKPQYRQIKLLIHLCLKGNNGSEIHLNHGLRAQRQNNKLLFCYPVGKIKGRIPAQEG